MKIQVPMNGFMSFHLELTEREAIYLKGVFIRPYILLNQTKDVTGLGGNRNITVHRVQKMVDFRFQAYIAGRL